MLAASLLGCKGSQPGKVESSVVSAVKHHITVRGRADRNPLPNNAETLRDGQEAFSHYCVACHGMDGRNTGVPFAARMSPPVPSLASQEVQSYSDGQLKWILDNGIRPSGMPGSRGVLSDDELWSIVVFLRHLPPEGGGGTLEMYTH